MIFNKKTKWIVLGKYSHTTDDYVVFVRGSFKTGLLDFKVKKVQGFSYSNRILPNNFIDTKLQWDTIIDLINKPKK